MQPLVAGLLGAGIGYSITGDNKWRIFNAVGTGVGAYVLASSLEK